MSARPFLTSLDSRGAVKGSRDPLGAQSVWVHFGRKIIGNLTTQSTLVPDFTVLLVGLHLAELVGAEQGDVSALDVFLRWEQLAAYVRVLKGVRGFRGVDRARLNLEKSSRVTLSGAPRDQVLGDQRVYGIWGLYMVAARTSGFVVPGTHQLAPAGRDLVESVFIPKMERGNPKILARLERELGRRDAWSVNFEKEAALVDSVAAVLMGKRGQAESERYRTHLIRHEVGDQTHGRQRELAALLESNPIDSIDPSAIRALTKEARARKQPALVQALDQVRVTESVLAPATRTFGWLLGQQGRTRAQVLGDLRRVLGSGAKSVEFEGLRELRGDFAIATGTEEASQRWLSLGEAFATGQVDAVLDGLLAHNREVMRERNGSSPWIEFVDDELRVHFVEDASDLFTRDELPGLWQHPYFISSLKSVIGQIEGTR